MELQALQERIPEYAKDLKLNLSSLLRDTTLTEQQQWGTVLAAAIAARSQELLAAIEPECREHLSDQAQRGARTAAALMGMNNVYYRFVHLVSNQEYGSLPAKLRMNAIANPEVDKADFELWSLAVSAVNGCGLCLDSHERVLRGSGVKREAVQQAVRIAAVIHAIAATLEAEQGLAA